MLLERRTPAPLKVISQSPGRGGRVAVPMATVARVTGRMTAGGGDDFELTRADLEKIAANFGVDSRPVAVYFGHIPRNARTETPAAAFVDRVWVEDDTLWGELDLGPTAFARIVEERGFRSFSVELVQDRVTPTGEQSTGFSLVGGAFTNTPALDVAYIAASESRPAAVEITSDLVSERPKESHMADEKGLAQLEAEVQAKTAQVKDLETQLTARETRIRELSEQLAEFKNKSIQLDAEEKTAKALARKAEARAEEADRAKAKTDEKVAELSAKVAELEKAQLAADVRNVVETAIRQGVAPALFEGWEDDPAEWLTAKYGRLEVLRTVCSVAPKAELNKRVKSGIDDKGNEVTTELAAELKRRGLDPKYLAVADSRDLSLLKK